MIKRAIVTFAAAAIAAATIAAPALADTWDDDRSGAYVYVSGKSIVLRDNADDGKFVSVNYRYNGGLSSGSLVNKAGYLVGWAGTYLTSDVTNSQNCQSRPWPLPMSCSPWKF